MDVELKLTQEEINEWANMADDWIHEGFQAPKDYSPHLISLFKKLNKLWPDFYRMSLFPNHADEVEETLGGTNGLV